MKEEDNILKKVGKENVFRVPDGYFENLTFRGDEPASRKGNTCNY